jgi:hypothetical protein
MLGNRICCSLETGDLQFEEPIMEHIDNLRMFDMEGYRYFKNAVRTNGESIKTIVEHPNKFFTTLSEDEAKQFAIGMFECKVELQTLLHHLKEEGTLTDTVIKNVLTDVKNILLNLARSINLKKLVNNYVKEHVIIELSKDIGTQPQDTREMTFNEEEVSELTEVVIICKLFSPLFGHFLAVIQKSIATSAREYYCASMLSSIIKVEYYSEIKKKLDFYVAKSTGSKNSDKNATALYNNSATGQMICTQLVANLMVRRFVYTSLDGVNVIMCSVSTTCKRAASKMTGGVKVWVDIRDDPSNTDMGGDEGNKSILEAESRRSVMTSDVPSIVKCSVRDTVEKEYVLTTMDLFDKLYGFYSKSPTCPNACNRYLLATRYGTKIGRAASLDHIDSELYTKLLVLLQIYMLEEFDNLHDTDLPASVELLHWLSAIKTDTPKDIIPHIDTALLTACSVTTPYANLCEKYSFKVGDIRWNTQLEIAARELSTTVFMYNTPPVVWDMLGMENMNGSVLKYSANITTALCMFLDQNSGG